jgi:hypothetical protein
MIMDPVNKQIAGANAKLRLTLLHVRNSTEFSQPIQQCQKLGLAMRGQPLELVLVHNARQI